MGDDREAFALSEQEDARMAVYRNGCGLRQEGRNAGGR
ncbi:hypothetical protein C9F11_20695 [Streptomyces sp. YIM 121038]|nr:hypothetical protein C9F11_20695 [Streptomyces sp. YIM 121038]